MTQIALSEKSGLKQSTLSDLERGKSAGTTHLAQVAQALGVNALWLETGRGGRDSVSAPSAALDLLPGAMPVIVGDDDEDSVKIPMVTLHLQAGMTGFQTENDRRGGGSCNVPKRFIAEQRLDPARLIAIHVRGDSMEGSLYDNDLVVINTADTKPVDGVVFAVNYEGEAVVKRMARDAGDWWLNSDNLDQRKYPRKICRGDACIVIGRIVRKESSRI
ncbi:helix-turn-helix transcriptional regulator [Massilia violaceinigra]|uniref:Helix-turn-helix transcriptional regulator n=1 Tax=Massilia violaceinigra TaxID=2045208 RepID=A0ABY4A3M1_9BURK|nr:S24 family peptidase [Massilia violaceinigra]UOD28755.1 helix-turn-helix transcriptional regulator [Massilia violaceinigra]